MYFSSQIDVSMKPECLNLTPGMCKIFKKRYRIRILQLWILRITEHRWGSVSSNPSKLLEIGLKIKFEIVWERVQNLLQNWWKSRSPVGLNTQLTDVIKPVLLAIGTALLITSSSILPTVHKPLVPLWSHFFKIGTRQEQTFYQKQNEILTFSKDPYQRQDKIRTFSKDSYQRQDKIHIQEITHHCKYTLIPLR